MNRRFCPVRRSARAGARHAFTLIELLVVISIIAILVALLLPNLGNFLRKGHQAASVSNLRNWFAGFSGAVGDNGGEMPTPGYVNGSFDDKDEQAWYNRMPRALKLIPMADFTNETRPKVGEKSIWNNPVVTAKYAKGSGSLTFLFQYGYNYQLVTQSSQSEPAPMKLAALQFPALTILMGEKADLTPQLEVVNVMAFWGNGKPERNGEQDNLANFLFCDGHVAPFKRKEFADQNLTTSEQAIKDKRTSLTFIPALPD